MVILIPGDILQYMVYASLAGTYNSKEISNSLSLLTRAITTIIYHGKLVARVTVEGAVRDLYEGSQLPKVHNGG